MASQKEPLQLYNVDIDSNGMADPVLTSYSAGKAYPFATMDDITTQVPSLRKSFTITHLTQMLLFKR